MAYVMGMINSNSREKTNFQYFPTPPWATRALVEHVIEPKALLDMNILEPACGQGHMAEVMKEYSQYVYAMDIQDMGYGEVGDYLNTPTHGHDWIITNPPFNMAVEFTLKALEEAKFGVAMLCRTQWLEGKNRYEKLFHYNPPTIFAPFCERVPMVKGRWEPTATTPMSYSWFVWIKEHGMHPPIVRWIPPGQRKLLTRKDDVEKFACIS